MYRVALWSQPRGRGYTVHRTRLFLVGMPGISLARRMQLLQNSRTVKDVSTFKKIKPAQLRKLAMAMETVHCVGGEVIVAMGERGDSFYIIESGECSVSFGEIEGGRNMTPGTLFGELALLTDDEGLLKRTATVTAAGDCTLLRVPAKQAQPVLRRSLGGVCNPSLFRPSPGTKLVFTPTQAMKNFASGKRSCRRYQCSRSCLAESCCS